MLRYRKSVSFGDGISFSEGDRRVYGLLCGRGMIQYTHTLTGGGTVEILEERQKDLCVFIRQYTEKNSFPPTIREIGQALGWKSTSSVKHHLDQLRQAGYLQWTEGKSRSILLTELLEKEGSPWIFSEERIPVLGHVAAGTPIWTEEDVKEYASFDTVSHPNDCFVLRVRGEAMTGVGIFPNDLVVVHRQTEARSGQIVVALFGDEATVKTLSYRNGAMWLLPENPDYEPMDGTHAQIIGRVVSLIRHY